MATKRATATASEIDLSKAAMLSRFKLLHQLAFEQYRNEVEEAHRAALNSVEREDELAQRTGRAAFGLRLFTEPRSQPAARAEFERLKLAMTFEQVAEGLRAFDEVKGGQAGGRVSDRLRAVEFMSDMFSAHKETASKGPSADPVLNAVLGVEGSLFGVAKRRPTRGTFRQFESDSRQARQGAYLDLSEKYEPADFLVALLCSRIAAIVEKRRVNGALLCTTEDRSATLIAESWFRLSRGRDRGMKDTLDWLSKAGFEERLAIQALISTWDPSRGFDKHNDDANKWLRKQKIAVPEGTGDLLTQDRRTKVVRQILCLDGSGGSGSTTPTAAESLRLALIREVESGLIPAAAEPPR